MYSVCVCLYVCVHIYTTVYISTHTYTHTHTQAKSLNTISHLMRLVYFHDYEIVIRYVHRPATFSR